MEWNGSIWFYFLLFIILLFFKGKFDFELISFHFEWVSECIFTVNSPAAAILVLLSVDFYDYLKSLLKNKTQKQTKIWHNGMTCWMQNIEIDLEKSILNSYVHISMNKQNRVIKLGKEEFNSIEV